MQRKELEFFLEKPVNIRKKDSYTIKGKIIETTVGRVLFNDLLPDGFPYVNEIMDKIRQAQRECENDCIELK